ncbi:hypothetical protein SteCoe_35823 [Stentor coeruleus]|uniref:Phosphodiesterase n=1 Tax=Stentor coeruleus TaxID=5963 RepID=A0A1R2ARR0_9CILI|nr:hypothetical protein SteCoe_35823 [Stentor coeruleus]
MNRSISKMYDEDQELSDQAKHPSEYSILKHDKNEIPFIPVDPNLLFFHDKTMQNRYFEILYISQTTNTISKEFRYNLLSFYIYLTGFMLIALGIVISLFEDQKISVNQLVFHLSSIFSILFYSYFLLFCILKSIRIVRINRVLYMLLGFLTYLYMIFGAIHVLSSFTGDTSTGYIPMTAGIIGFTYSYRRILFDSYRHLVLTLIPILIIYLSINLIYSETLTYNTIGEFAAIALFVITQIIETHVVENRTIQLFYRMEREQDTFFDDEIHKPNVENENSYFHSVIELIINKCDFIIKEIKYAASIVIYKDVKTRLKNVQNEINVIRNKVSKLDYIETFEITSQDIDEEDREFISQNYLNVSSLPNKSYPITKDINVEGQKTSFIFNSKLLIKEVVDHISKVGYEWNFNVFYLNEMTGRSISVFAVYLFKKLSIEDILYCSEQEFFNYFDSLEKVNNMQTYKVNPYHNALHAAEVFASIYYFINNSELLKSINKLDTICTLIASFGHDVGHPGLTNRYLIQSRDKIAIQYNDISVLENMHCSIIFTLLSLGNTNFLSHLSDEDWVICRKVILTMVLDTDLSRHFEVFTKFRTRSSVMNDLSIEKIDDKILILSTALKCADIGHSAKSQEIHKRWTSMVMEEFFNQGDLEKKLGLPVSMYCDRNNTDIPKSQVGFLRNICIPLYEIWCSFLKSHPVDQCLGQLRENYQYWDQSMKTRMFTQVKRLQDESL